jgi:hypothetical protein
MNYQRSDPKLPLPYGQIRTFPDKSAINEAEAERLSKNMAADCHILRQYRD